MTRASLPNRRPNRTVRIEWSGHRFHLTIGLSPKDASPTEVFFSDGMKTGTDLRHTIQDACVMVSMLLQHGETAETIGRSLSADGVVGAVVRALRDQP